MNTLSVGTFGKMRFGELSGKSSEYEADKLEALKTPRQNIVVYQVKRGPKDLETITRYPDIRKAAGETLYTLGASGVAGELAEVSIALSGEGFTVSGVPERLASGAPVFNANGEILGMITGKDGEGHYQAIGIGEILDYSVSALGQQDLYPTWKELYPSQYAMEKVLASAAILETDKPGTGFFIGRDKDSTGYILTANHVVEGDVGGNFSVTFYQNQDESFDGQVLAGSQNPDLDLAIVTVPNCPAYTAPVTFWSPKSLGKLKEGKTAQTIANVGWTPQPNPRYGYFESSNGEVLKVSDPYIYSTLQVQSGYSGGPIYNENGEVLSITLRAETTTIETDDPSAAPLQATATTHNRAILDYLDDTVGKVDFIDRWQFLIKPTFWQKNRWWMLTGGAAGSAAAAAILLQTDPPPADLPGNPAFPSGGN